MVGGRSFEGGGRGLKRESRVDEGEGRVLLRERGKELERVSRVEERGGEVSKRVEEECRRGREGGSRRGREGVEEGVLCRRD